MLLDQRIFQYQGLEFGLHDDIVEIAHVVDADRYDAVAVLLFRAEILAQPVFQVLRLADIKYAPLAVLHQVDAGQRGQGEGFFAQGGEVRVGHGGCPILREIVLG